MKLDALNEATHAHCRAHGVPFTMAEILEHLSKVYQSPVIKALRSREPMEFSGGTQLAKSVIYERQS
jgi:hypothetical protein